MPDDTLKIRYVETTEPWCNTELLHIIRERYDLKYQREFNLGGSGLQPHNVRANSCVPAGARKYFLSCAMQTGIDSLDAISKTVAHGVPQTNNFDDTQTLKLVAEDAPTVWRRVDAYLRGKKRYSNAIYQRYDNNARGCRHRQRRQFPVLPHILHILPLSTWHSCIANESTGTSKCSNVW
ncbi:hypothetical protein JTB14_029784 [Gonioctena quinquepunctata]|nr:hypothetical protein JTB14_029784 [Gonioctena quinquepunctata]